MNTLTRIAVVLGGFTLLFPYPVSSIEPPWLSGNPFSRPSSEVTLTARARIAENDGTTLPLDLKATLVAQKNELANVGGIVLRPGEEINGYRLVSVYEDRAVFVREGKPLTVYVKPDLADEND